MAATFERSYRYAIHPLHAVMLASTIPLYLGALLSDWAYSSTYQMQWANFAAWLIAGALLFSGLALAWALVDLIRANRRGGGLILYFFLLLATFILAFVNILVHSKDAWAIMPDGLILSVIVALLAIAATWAGFSGFRAGAVR